jgi:hypothetical protein
MKDLVARVCGEQTKAKLQREQASQQQQQQGVTPAMGFAFTVWGLKRRITKVANSDMDAARGWRRDMGMSSLFQILGPG